MLRDSLRSLLKISPSLEASALIGSARAAEKRGDIRSQISFLEAIVTMYQRARRPKVDPYLGLAYIGLAKCYLRTGDRERGVVNGIRALELMAGPVPQFDPFLAGPATEWVLEFLEAFKRVVDASDEALGTSTMASLDDLVERLRNDSSRPPERGRLGML